MWIKEDGTWSRETNILSSDEFKPTLQRLQTYAKCLNASTYSVTNQLEDIYSILNYQHGFYVEILPGGPDQLYISDVLIQKGQMYNLSLTHTKHTIISNLLDLEVGINDDDIEYMTIRTAIALGYIKAANSLLFDDKCGFEYWDAYLAPNMYNVTVVDECWTVETDFGTSGTAGTSGTSGTSTYEPFKNIILKPNYTEADVYSVFANDERNYGWSLSTIWTPDKLLKKLLNNFKLVDLASTENVDLTIEWFELIIDGKTVNDQMLILLKNQTNAYENGVYRLVNRFLIRSTILDEIDELEYFSAYVKEGLINKEKQFFLERLPNGRFPYTDFGTSGMALNFVEGFNYAIRNRVDYKLLQNNTIRDSQIFEELTPILNAYETFNFSYNLNGFNYRISNGGDFMEIRNIATGDVTLVGLVDNSTSADLTAIQLNALNVLRKSDNDQFIFINSENNVTVVYSFDPVTYVSTAIYSTEKIYDASVYLNYLYILVDTSVNNVKTSKIVKININTMTVVDVFTFDFFILELQVFVTSSVEWYFFNDRETVYIFNKTYGSNVLVSNAAKYLTLNMNVLAEIIDSGTAGTAGTSGILPETDLLISWIDQETLSPVRYRKTIESLNDYALWLAQAYLENGTNGIASEFIIKTDFSKVQIGDWKVADDTLYLKNTNILVGTNGVDVIPKISNTTGRYFDGKDDFIDFGSLNFENVEDFSIEFVLIPEALINNTRVFYFATEKVNDVYSSVEFLLLDVDTGKSKFFFRDNANLITVDCSADFIVGVRTRVTITAEFSQTQNNQYVYTIRVWFNDTVVGTSSGLFAKTISQLGSLTKCFIGKTDSTLDPVLRGEVREFRISNIVLNPAQIASRDRAIIVSDLTYPSLLFYWNLYDTTSHIVDQIGRRNGTFYGGLAFDTELSSILTPRQILFSQDSQYLYLLSNLDDQDIAGTAGTSGTVQSRIFRIDLRTEDLDLLYESYSFVKSIYVENNLLYWLEDNLIYQYNIDGNILIVTISIPTDDILDFVAVNDKTFYVDINNNIYDQFNTNVTSSGYCVPNANEIVYVYGLYQNFNNINWYNVYFKTTSNEVEIISTTFTPVSNITGDTFECIATYPFYDKAVYKKQLSNFGYTFAITADNTVVQIVGQDVINLDINNQYWGYQVSSIFGISLPMFDYLYIGSINTNSEVQIWRYEILTNKIVLMQYLSDNTVFETETDLDMIVTSDISGKFLTIIKPDHKTFRRFKLEDIYLRLNSLEIDINLELTGVLHELQNISLNQFYYTIYRDNLLWVGRGIRSNDVTYWTTDMQYEYKDYAIFAADFGVAFMENASTSGHSLDLLQTLVKWDFKQIQMVIDNSINSSNFISPAWLGVAYIVGQDGGVLITRDYASTWQAISSDSPNTFNAISLKNSEEALIVGENSTILQTFSAGQFYDQINVDTDLTFNREFTDVLIYNNNAALVVGKGGLIIHLSLDDIKRTWEISSNILNNTDLVTVTQADLESRIKPRLKQDSEINILLTNYTKIIQESENQFWLFGDRGLITHLTLNFVNNQIHPAFVFYQASNFTGNTLDAVKITDYADGIKKFFIISSDSVYAFKVQGATDVENSNLKNITVDKITSTDYSLTDINVKKNHLERPIRYEELYLSGTLNNIKKGDFQLQDYTNTQFSTIRPISLTAVDPIINEYFKPRMLFTDYYLARKINIILEPENWIVPKVDVDKHIFDCYKFLPGESIEFSVYDTDKNPNYLAIQDWYYTTRRIMQIDPNGDALDGTVKQFPYNKKLTAVADMTNYITSQDSSTYFSNGPVISNIDYYNSPSFSVKFPEQFVHTVITAPSNLIVAASDVIALKISRIQIDENNLPFEKLLLDDVFIVKHVETDNTIVLWDLLDQDILADAQFGLAANSASTAGYGNWKIEIHNLNYFISDAGASIQPLLALKTTLQKHLLGKVYDMTITTPDILPIFAMVNMENRYANLETIVTIKLNTGTYSYDLKYDNNTVYGPNYNILNFLQNLDPTLNPDYELKNLTTFNANLNGLSGPFELSISRNLISVGESYIPTILQYLPGTWVDVTLGNTTVKRVRIDKVEHTTFSTGVRRVILHTDVNLSSRFANTVGANVTIRPRTKLGEISKDLEFTDNINMPRPITDGEYGTNGMFEFSPDAFGSYKYGYYNYVQTASSYARWLMNDPRIKAVISATIWLDNDNDLRLNVYSWNTDPNFAFRPLDLYEVGIDFVLKKAITVLDINWDINDNFFGLKNIDFEKYNFFLTDQLDLVKLNQRYPWILNANVRNAVIGEEDYVVEVRDKVTGELLQETRKRLRWYTGQWFCGTWENGAWYSGDAYEILWLRGDWYSLSVTNVFNIWTIDFKDDVAEHSNWFSGVFGSGIWHNGIWYNGTWQSGTHITGEWFGGNWLNGEWNNGLWAGGIWYNGTWLNGVFNSDNLQSIWIDGTWLGGDFENGTWQNGIWDQGAGKKSRFGTKSTTVQPAIWEFGQWKNGEFHSFLNVNANNEPIASATYRASVWRNGIWEGGNWYGGTWERGLWKNGVWHFGLWRSLLELEKVERVTVTMQNQPSTISTWLRFKKPHYLKYTSAHLDFENQGNLDNKLLNLVTVLGEPDVSSGELPLLIKGDASLDQQNGLGWNSFPIQHVVKIEDERSLSIQYLPTGGDEYVGKNLVGETDFFDPNIYGTNGTAAYDTSGTAGTSGFVICIDRNLILPPVPEVEIYEFLNVYLDGPFAVSHWQDGTFKAGIWEKGYWNNGRWEGGIWLNGVWERGVFGAS